MLTELEELIAAGAVPEPVRRVLLGFRWELDRLFALELPVEAVRVQDFEWLLDLPFWREKSEWFMVTPNEVREQPEEHEEQWTRTLRADLDQPIHITEREGGSVIIDGIHRLLKASIEGRETVPARRVPAEMLPLIATDP